MDIQQASFVPVPDNVPRRRQAAPVAEFAGSFTCLAEELHLEHTLRGNGASKFINYFIQGWDNLSIWKSAFIECIATMLLVYVSGVLDQTLGSFDTPQIAPYVGITNIFLLTLFILAAGPSSGGHMNPLISFAVTISGLMSFCRGVLYISAQLLGAAIAGGLLRGSMGHERTVAAHGGGCFILPGSISSGQALIIESVSSFALLFLAFGVGLDPRQKQLFGALLGPLAVGCSLGLISFATAGFAKGYTGAGVNPARCFAFAVASNDFNSHWIWWVGPAIGAVVHTSVYFIVPPYHVRPTVADEANQPREPKV